MRVEQGIAVGGVAGDDAVEVAPGQAVQGVVRYGPRVIERADVADLGAAGGEYPRYRPSGPSES